MNPPNQPTRAQLRAIKIRNMEDAREATWDRLTDIEVLIETDGDQLTRGGFYALQLERKDLRDRLACLDTLLAMYRRQ